MAGSPFLIQICDSQGRTVTTLNGVDIDGTVAGVRTCSYTLEGGQIDEIGSLSFDAPLSVARNQALITGGEVKVFEADVFDANGIPAPIAWGVIGTKSVTTSRDGTTAQFKCDEVVSELARLTPSSGFATLSPPDPVESLTAIGIRLVSAMADPASPSTIWSFSNSLTTLDGLPFNCYNTSIYGGVTKLAKERFAHAKRGQDRTIIFSRMGESSGLALMNPGTDPTKAAAIGATEMRGITAFGHTFEGKIFNDVVPIGGSGSGVVQLDLSLLYGDTTFTGYNAAHPIKRRTNQAGGGVDGFDYYIEDTISIYGDATHVANGRWQNPNFTRTDIVATGTSAGEQREAAMRLYVVAVAELGWNSQPHNLITVTTEGRGDLRGIGGKTVLVDFLDPTSGDYVSGTYVVMKHLRRWQDGVCNDDWTLSDLGTYARGAAAEYNGVVQTVNDLAAIPSDVPAQWGTHIETIADASDPVVYTIIGSKAFKRVIYCTITVTPVPMRVGSHLIDHVHPTPLPEIPHDIVDLPHDVNAIPHDVAFNAAGNYEFRVGGSAYTTTSVVYDPGVKIDVQGAAPPAGAVQVYFDGHFFYAQGKAAFAVTAAETLSIQGAAATTGGTGGTTVKTTGAATGTGEAGGTVPKTSGGKAGKTTALRGASAPISDMRQADEFGIVRGPSATGITLKVGGVAVAGPSNGALSYDAALLVSPQGNTQIEVDAAGVGGLTIDIDMLRVCSSI